MSYCLACEKPLKGRIDKKFCDNECRNDYNNERYRLEQKVVLDINKILRKNRKILNS